jgi:hypothetical protein
MTTNKYKQEIGEEAWTKENNDMYARIQQSMKDFMSGKDGEDIILLIDESVEKGFITEKQHKKHLRMIRGMTATTHAGMKAKEKLRGIKRRVKGVFKKKDGGVAE